MHNKCNHCNEIMDPSRTLFLIRRRRLTVHFSFLRQNSFSSSRYKKLVLANCEIYEKGFHQLPLRHQEIQRNRSQVSNICGISATERDKNIGPDQFFGFFICPILIKLLALDSRGNTGYLKKTRRLRLRNAWWTEKGGRTDLMLPDLSLSCIPYLAELSGNKRGGGGGAI